MRDLRGTASSANATSLMSRQQNKWLQLSRHEETWKTAEILILRHQLAVLQRQQPRRPNLDWADRVLSAYLSGHGSMISGNAFS